MEFEFSQFHFADIRWLWGLLLVPVVSLLYMVFYRSGSNIQRLENIIDKELIPHLLLNTKLVKISVWKSIILASILWSLLLCAMSGPRWEFKEFYNFSNDRVLVILLDLSTSMEGNDISPSRLVRAKHEIEDLINLDPTLKIGVIVFAADAHILSPITNNTNNIKYYLPALGSDLLMNQGTKIVPALKTAKEMLENEAGLNKSILVISDGGYVDISDAKPIITELVTEHNVKIMSYGIATEQGVQIFDANGKNIIQSGKQVLSVLEKDNLITLAKMGNGKYFSINDVNSNNQEILNQINLRSSFEEDEKNGSVKQWRERFYLFLIPVMLIILLWFRKGFYFPLILVILLSSAQYVQAANMVDKLFLNKDQQASKALQELEDFDSAIELFNDPYNKGVAYYKAGKYQEAEAAFRQNTRPDLKTKAQYNLANALAKQGKLEESVETYLQILQQDPKHVKSQHNLGVVKSMIVKAAEKKQDDKDPKKKPQDPPKPDGLPDGGGGGGGSGDDEEDEDQDQKDNKDDKEDEADEKSDNKNKDDAATGQNKEAPNNVDSAAEEQWIDQVGDDIKKLFLRSQFALESQNQNNQDKSQNIDPW